MFGAASVPLIERLGEVETLVGFTPVIPFAPGMRDALRAAGIQVRVDLFGSDVYLWLPIDVVLAHNFRERLSARPR